MSYKKVMASLVAAAFVTACGDSNTPVETQAEASSGVAAVDTQRIMNAAKEPEMWLTYGGSYDETRH